jgi:hypothetical protein
MSTPAPTGARPDSNVLGGHAMPPAAGPQPEEPEYVLWPYTGEGSVCFYPPGSVEEHLVTGHGIDSLEVRRKGRGHHDHARQHRGQSSVHPDTLGDLIAVGHAYEAAA